MFLCGSRFQRQSELNQLMVIGWLILMVLWLLTTQPHLYNSPPSIHVLHPCLLSCPLPLFCVCHSSHQHSHLYLPSLCFTFCLPFCSPVTLYPLFLLPSWRTHITRDMCFPGGGKNITTDMCFPGGRTHITRDICFPGGGTHTTRDMCFPGGETHITRNMCLPAGKHISLEICFPGGGTHITRDIIGNPDQVHSLHLVYITKLHGQWCQKPF